jgi:hypothetical protein
MLQHGLTCEHPKKDLANGDRLVEPVHQGFFFKFVKLVDWVHPKDDWAKFSERSDKRVIFLKKSYLVLATFFELIV